MIVRGLNLIFIAAYLFSSLEWTSGTPQKDPQDFYLDIPKTLVYSGSMLRIKSLQTNCWLDIKPNRFIDEESGEIGGFVTTCVPTYPTLPKKEFGSYEENLEYEPEGPFFHIMTPDSNVKPRKVHVDPLVKLGHGQDTHLVMEKAQGSCLAVTEYPGLVSKSFSSVEGVASSPNAEECTFQFYVEDGGDLTEGKMVNILNKKTGQLLSLSGRNLTEKTYGEGYQEVVGVSMDDIGNVREDLNVWVLDKVRMGEDIEFIDKSKFEAIYNEGNEKTEEAAKYPSLSYEDIETLHEAELDILRNILDTQTENDVNRFLASDGYTVEAIHKTDTKHPIDIYNVIKRTAVTWRKVRDEFERQDANVRESIDEFTHFFPNWDVVKYATARSILDLEFQYDMSPHELVRGTIRFGGKVFQASTKLRVDDVELIADVAGLQRYLDSKIKWLSVFPELQKQLRKTIRVHNELVTDPTALVANRYISFNMPINEDLKLNKALSIEGAVEEFEQRCFRQVKANSREKYYCEDLFLINPIKDQCQGRLEAPALGDNTCEIITYQDPYLKLGPFQLELHSNQPLVGQIHNYIFADEIAQLQQETSSQRSLFPASDINEYEELNSEIVARSKYFSERKHGMTRKLSQRMGLALSMNLFNPNYRYTSENYQVVNYGLGGQVRPHQDSEGLPVMNEMLVGGGRVTTATTFLSDVEAGGKIVFPYLKVGVVPKAGTLLYWTTKTNAGSTDYKMKHVECPVVYGNKWVANKWINRNEQMNRFPCAVNIEKRMFDAPHRNVSYTNPLHSNIILSA